MRAIAKGSCWDLHLQYQKDTGRTRPDVEYLFQQSPYLGEYVAWLEDSLYDYMETIRFAEQIHVDLARYTDTFIKDGTENDCPENS